MLDEIFAHLGPFAVGKKVDSPAHQGHQARIEQSHLSKFDVQHLFERIGRTGGRLNAEAGDGPEPREPDCVRGLDDQVLRIHFERSHSLHDSAAELLVV